MMSVSDMVFIVTKNLTKENRGRKSLLWLRVWASREPQGREIVATRAGGDWSPLPPVRKQRE